MKAEIVRMQLTRIMRQKDRIDGNILSRVRMGTQSDADLERLSHNVRPTPPFGSTVICLYNYQVDALNLAALAKCGGTPLHFEEIRKGSYRQKWKDGNWKLKSEYQPTLTLKQGCRVMLLRNGTSNIHGCKIPYYNGDTGIVEGVDKQERITILRDNGDLIRIGRHKIEDLEHVTQVATEEDEEGNPVEVKEIVEKSKGSVSQYPIRLAYAITCHKSQGATIERLHLQLPPSPVRFLRECPNLMYVALSRVTSIDNLSVSRKIEHIDINSSLKGKVLPGEQYENGLLQPEN